MKFALPPASTTRAAAVIAVIALIELVTGGYGLRAVIAHPPTESAIAERLQFACSALLMLTGIGLLRMRLWAARVTLALLFGAFFVVLALMSLAFEEHGASWYYWCLPLALPLLGSCVHVLRKERTRLVRRL